MATVLTERGPAEVAGAEARGEDLWLPAADVERATGWSLKEQGLCRNERCVPVPPGREPEFARNGRVNAAAFWRRMGAPVLHDAAGRVWMLGESAAHRASVLSSLEAPDFTLPDLDGALHSLRDHRGKKVLLVTWASW
jgi:hypothetical protein